MFFKWLKLHLPIRSSPFGRFEEPTLYMVKRVEQEAIAAGTPLSLEEKHWLAQEHEEPPSGSLSKLERLIGSIVENEMAGHVELDGKSFVGACEWAGDGAWPNVVELTVAAVERRPATFTERARRAIPDFIALWVTGIVIFLAMVVVVNVLAAFGLME